MSNQGGGKIRPRRTYSTKKPYARPKSTGLLGRVKDTLSHFTPSWLTSMWTPADNAGKVKENEDIDEEVQQSRTQPRRRVSFEGIESPILSNTSQREMGSRMQLYSTGGSSDYKSPVQMPFTRYQPFASSTPIEGEEEDESEQNAAEKGDDSNSDESVSTSGCSSLVPHVDKSEYRDRTERRTDTQRKTHADTAAKKDQKRNLWSDVSVTSANTSNLTSSGRRQPTGRSSTKPSFNASYFGASSFISDASTQPITPGGSSFYPGRTSFGGASAQRSSVKRRRTSPYEIYQPVKRQMRPKPVNNTSEDYGVTSMTAKRILDTLEKMSTPLSDARRIPLMPSSTPLSFTPSGRSIGRSRTPGGSFLASRGAEASTRMIPPVYGLKNPVSAMIAKNRQPAATLSKPPDQKVPSSTSTVSSKESERPSVFGFTAPSTSTSTIVSPPSSVPVETTVSRSGGKMKTKSRSNLHYSAAADDMDQVEQPDLPTAVPLPLLTTKPLPSFDFQIPKVAGSSLTFTTSSMSKPVTSTPRTSSIQPESSFKFSSPIVKEPANDVKCDSQESSQTTFQFSAPKPTPVVDNNMKTSSLFAVQDTSPLSAKPVIHKAKVEEESFSGGMKPAKELKSGSCLEVFGLLSNKKTSDTSKKEPEKQKAFTGFGQKSSKSEEITIIDDDEDEDSNDNSGKDKTDNTSTASKQTNIWDKFKPSSGSWNCSMCMINNTSNNAKCIACGEAKPGAQPQTQSSQFKFGAGTTTTTTTTTSTWGSQLKSASESWECPGCLVQNKVDVTKCPCCGESKPGAIQTSSSTFGMNTSSVGSLADQFKPASGSWECSVCSVQNNSDVSKCVACGEAKPGAKQTSASSQFSFGAPSNSSSTSTSQISFGFQEKNNKSGSPQSKSTSSGSNVWDKFKTTSGSWECDTCMVVNKDSDKKCVACQTPKPGTQPVLASPANGSFSFGVPATSNKVTDVSSSIVFGKSNNSTISGVNTAISSQETATSQTGISFGFPQTSQPDKPKASITLGTGLTTGINPKPSGISFETPNSDTQSIGSPKNGNVSTTLKSSGPANISSTLVSTQKIDSVVASGGFAFGAQKATDSGSVATGFVFGQNTDTAVDTKSELKSQEASVESGGFKLGTSVAPFKFGESESSVKPSNTQSLLGTTQTENKPTVQGTAAVFPFSGSSLTGTPVTASSSTGFTPNTFTGTPVTASSSTGFSLSTENKSNEAKRSTAFMFKAGTAVSNQATTPAGSSFNFTTQTKTEEQKKTQSDTHRGGILSGTKPTDTSGLFAFSAGGTPIATAKIAPGTTTSATTQSTTAVAPFQFSAGTPQSVGSTPTPPTTTTQNSTGNFGFTPTGSSAFPTTQTNTFSSASFPFAATTAAPTTAGFSFATTTTATATGGFPFSGAAPATTTTPAPAPAPAFGAGTTTTTFGSGFSTPSTFGNSTTSTSSAAGGFGSISAGTPASTSFPAAAPAFGATAAQQSTTPFGNTAVQQSSTATAFGSTPSQQSASTGGFPFNANQSANFGSTGVFQFSGSKDSTPVAQVGTTPTGGFTAPQAGTMPAAGGFTASQVGTMPAGGFNASTAAPQPSFNFGGSSPAPASTFNFNAAQASSNNPFSASGSVAGRKIKRPVRRRK
ncbi:nuclear pore complex protein Nup153-like [Glandiceps talaboti]